MTVKRPATDCCGFRSMVLTPEPFVVESLVFAVGLFRFATWRIAGDERYVQVLHRFVQAQSKRLRSQKLIGDAFAVDFKPSGGDPDCKCFRRQSIDGELAVAFHGNRNQVPRWITDEHDSAIRRERLSRRRLQPPGQPERTNHLQIAEIALLAVAVCLEAL